MGLRSPQVRRGWVSVTPLKLVLLRGPHAQPLHVALGGRGSPRGHRWASAPAPHAAPAAAGRVDGCSVPSEL